MAWTQPNITTKQSSKYKSAAPVNGEQVVGHLHADKKLALTGNQTRVPGFSCHCSTTELIELEAGVVGSESILSTRAMCLYT